MWANAWLAGAGAPDDVLDALSQWAPTHSVTAYDSGAAARTGLPWPELEDSGSVSLLQTLRTAVAGSTSVPAITVAQPVAGDVRGLPAGTQFQRDAVAVGAGRAVADSLGGRRAGVGVVVDDPRGMVEQILEVNRLHRVPDHAPTRAVRVLENAAHVDAIIAVSSGLMPIGLQSSSEVRIAGDALRPLARVVRSARLAALDAILRSAWRS